jgi:hypothetical protein
MSSNNEIEHVGVLGMHWGHRSSTNERGVPHSTSNLAKKDAERFTNAKMFYGKTAGTKRKLLNAELDKKHKNLPGYTSEFNYHLGNVDRAKAAKKAVSDRTRIDSIHKGRSLIKNILGVTGSLSVAVAGMAYAANKEKIDSFVMDQFGNLVRHLK